jgi:hypothetical protein
MKQAFYAAFIAFAAASLFTACSKKDNPAPAPTVAVTDLTLNKTTLSLAVGASETLAATVTPPDATNKTVAWQSAAPTVAKVDSAGKITAIAPGSATIIASSGGKTANCVVTVVPATVAVTGVSLSKTSLSLVPGSTSTLTATVAPTNATNKTVTWKSSNTGVASVTTGGIVTAVAAGSATITATSAADGSKIATCVVTVTDDITAAFTDAKFKAYVLNAFDDNHDGKIQLKEVNTRTQLQVGGNMIASLAGIEYFTALTYFDCGNNQLTALNVTKNTALEYLYCQKNQLPALDLSKNTALISLYCAYNKLTALDLSKNGKLSFMDCTNNSINPKVIYVWFTGGTPPSNMIFQYDAGIMLTYKQ